jgi:hypothetical protein
MPQPLVYVDGAQLRKLQQDLRKFEPKALTTLRREVKRISKVAQDAVKEAVMQPPPSGDRVPGSVAREAVASGVSVKLSFGKRSAGVQLIASGKNLSPEHVGFLAAYNENQWDHPVFRRGKVTQHGAPYFGAVIKPIADDEMLGALAAAFDKAAQSIGAKVR